MSTDEFLTIQAPNGEAVTLLFPGHYWVKNRLLKMRLLKWVAPGTFQITTLEGLKLLNEIMSSCPNPQERALHAVTNRLTETLSLDRVREGR